MKFINLKYFKFYFSRKIKTKHGTIYIEKKPYIL